MLDIEQEIKGVLDVDLLSVIRRWHFRDGLSIREITRRTKLSRNTSRKYLASGEVEPAYPKRHTLSKIDDYAEVLSSWLTRESGRSRKQRRNLRQLYGDLVHLGYRDSPNRVSVFARAWRVQQQEAVKASRGTFIPLVFAPGEAFQFDWSEDWVVIGGERVRRPERHSWTDSPSTAISLRLAMIAIDSKTVQYEAKRKRKLEKHQNNELCCSSEWVNFQC